jgi:hypothetical protein
MPLMWRQLAKMLLTAEEGRSMVFHAARVLQAADAGDARMAKVLRIVTPLIKFRTCRDARKVAGDAMEVRGGCGYIEEWSDARVLRDAHLGSIWEGTSNIVALDVARAARRDGALVALGEYAEELRESASKEPAMSGAMDTFRRARDFLDRIASNRDAHADARTAATAVYHATAAIFMAWEAAGLRAKGHPLAADRAALATAVIDHKLTARDPLDGAEDDDAGLVALLDHAFYDSREPSEPPLRNEG